MKFSNRNGMDEWGAQNLLSCRVVMCWSWEVSLFFAVIESVGVLACLYVVFSFPEYYRKKHRRPLPWATRLHLRRVLWAMPFIISINMVEWSEVGIWWSEPQSYHVLMEDADTACAQCAAGNFFFTTTAGFAIGFQPLFTCLFLYKTHCDSFFYKIWHRVIRGVRHRLPQVAVPDVGQEEQGEREEDGVDEESLPTRPTVPARRVNRLMREMEEVKEIVEAHLADEEAQKEHFFDSRGRFSIAWMFAILFTLVIFVCWVVLSLFPHSMTLCPYDNSFVASMASSCTCSYEGKYGHLMWTFMFPCKIRDFLPSLFDYFLLANLAPLFYGPWWMAIPMMVSLPLFLVELLWYWGSTEVYSIWCWTGVGAVGIHMFCSLILYDDKLLSLLETSGMNGSASEVLYLCGRSLYVSLAENKPVMDMVAKLRRKIRRCFFLR